MKFFKKGCRSSSHIFINLEVTIIGTSGTSVTVEAGRRGLKIKPARFMQERKSNHQTKNYYKKKKSNYSFEDKPVGN